MLSTPNSRHRANTMTLPSFEAEIYKALEDKTIPGVVLLARSRDGKVNYAKNINPWDETTVFRLTSMTKLFTSIAMGKAIERGLVTLDTDVTLQPASSSRTTRPVRIF